MNIRHRQEGFSLLEVIITIMILGIIFGTALIYTQSSQVRADVNAQAANIIGQLRLIQSNAESGNVTKATSVHLEPSSYTTFVGDTYIEGAESNFTVELPPTIEITNISLLGNGQNIIFLTPDGSTNTSGSFDVFSGQIAKTKTINITQLGTIDY